MAAQIFENGVIVADNDHLIRGILRSMLEQQGLRVFLASDGVEAVDYATRMVAQLVILDLNMPRLNGFCACEQIRQLPGYAKVPIAVLSAYDTMDMREAAERVGVTQFFAKPFTVVDLLEGIMVLLGLHERASAAAAAAAKPMSVIWKRHQEPTAVYEEAPQLSQGRRVLDIYRK